MERLLLVKENVSQLCHVVIGGRRKPAVQM